MFKIIAAALAGGVMGFTLGYFVMAHRKQKQMKQEMDQLVETTTKIDEINKTENVDYENGDKDGDAEVTSVISNINLIRDYMSSDTWDALNKKTVPDIAKSSSNNIPGWFDEVDAEEEHPEDDDEDDQDEDEEDIPGYDDSVHEYPYTIVLSAYTNTRQYYNKIAVTYYAQDDVFVDEHECVIDDPKRLFGDDIVDIMIESDSGIVYIRNDVVGSDYEIELNQNPMLCVLPPDEEPDD